MQVHGNDAGTTGSHSCNGGNTQLDLFSLKHIQSKIAYTLNVINTGKKITSGVVKNVSLLWDEERRDFNTPHGKAVVGFRKAFLIKINNRTKMVGMPFFRMWENAIEVLKDDIGNPFLGDIRDVSKLCSFPEGIYVGELQNGKPHGMGKMVFRDTWSFYNGEWKDGLYHGVGNLILKYNEKRDIYEGEWQNGMKHGKGKLIHIGTIYPENAVGWVSGKCYIYNGDWRRDQKHGIGKIVKYSDANEHPIETVYEGEWEDNIFHGKGKFLNYRGDIYTGDFLKGERNGFGKIIYYNDEETEWYEGTWRDDAEYGKGKKMFKNGDFYEGQYYNFDEVFMDDYGHRYKGKKIFANGDIYVGDFYYHIIDGEGEMFCTKDGSTYRGMWSKGMMHGNGTLTYLDGTVCTGEWYHGVYEDDDEIVGRNENVLQLGSEHEESSDDLSDNTENCPSCKTTTVSFIKSFPNPNVMCMCCRDEFCPIYVTLPCGHFICEECKETYYGRNIPDIGVLNIYD